MSIYYYESYLVMDLNTIGLAVIGGSDFVHSSTIEAMYNRSKRKINTCKRICFFSKIFARINNSLSRN